MRLSDLEPDFLSIESEGHYRIHHDIARADGVQFLCPVCFTKNGGAVGTHYIVCWQPHVPQTVSPTPGRWNLQGTGYDDLTLVAASSSVLLPTSPCRAHFFVRSGEITLT